MEIHYENTTDISNKISELEKEEILLKEQEFKLSKPLTEIKHRLSIIKIEKSLLNKAYWRAKE